MCHRGVLVHCPSCFGAAAAVLTNELPRVVTVCLQSGQLNLAKPFINLMV